MAKGRERYTRAMLEDAARNSRSVAEAMRNLAIKPAGGSRAYIRRRLKELAIDTSHFLGRRWNTGGKQTGGPEKRSAAQILILRNPTYPPERTRFLRRALIEIGRKYVCAECGMDAMWNGRSLVLQIDHISGDRHDNRAENLRFLCPNCHSQTPNFSRRK
ncbi:MAG: HNH endonuclease [Chloroflexi bacterium]|nr:HNH endonuclease [Chloroflexota bacterium]